MSTLEIKDLHVHVETKGRHQADPEGCYPDRPLRRNLTPSWALQRFRQVHSRLTVGRP